MLETTARLLQLLGLLQTHREWSGSELAGRLEVTTRTIRRDVECLRQLGYSVHTSRGAQGGYQLGADAVMPPLLLDDDDAVAIAVGLRSTTHGGVTGIEETSVRALAKLEQIMPERLRRRVRALQSFTVHMPGHGPSVQAEVLTEIATACRDEFQLRFKYLDYHGEETSRIAEPYRLVTRSTRWYLVAWDVRREDWRNFRVDRITLSPPHGRRFTPRELPDEDIAGYVARGTAVNAWTCKATVRMNTPAEEVERWVPQGSGIVTPVDDASCTLQIGGSSYQTMANWLGWFDADFEVIDSPELREALTTLARRFHNAAGPTEP
ncbi:transcriptional regulator [Saxibacter everestensis]|uniref:Transcriptional regulator n=1 Tax=Saxibacter everestensis TaxID=2909229 RepID=A0ABY8QQM7_9MICO|nr:transcriptional regulator [Brevibacteriaceae bacterium ZFBP1038]